MAGQARLRVGSGHPQSTGALESERYDTRKLIARGAHRTVSGVVLAPTVLPGTSRWNSRSSAK